MHFIKESTWNTWSTILALASQKDISDEHCTNDIEKSVEEN